jgi:hypothetical protein
MTRRLNITLPERTVANLRKQLRKGARVRAERDSHVAEEWSALDLRGLLRKPGRKPVSLEAMDGAIRAARARRP